MPPVLRPRTRRKDGQGASSGRLDNGPTPLADPAPGAAYEPVALELGGRDGMRGSCFSGDFAALEEGGLRGQPSGKEGDT